MIAFLSRVLDLLPSKKVIVDSFPGPILFVGDLHGDPTAVRVAELFVEETGGKVVFLGDYADRGRYQRETLQALFQFFLKHPNSVVLLRGNHEMGPKDHDRYVGPVYPYDVSFYLSPEELSLYEEVHVKLPVIYLNEAIGIVAVHGFLSSFLISDLPRDITPEEEFLIVWSDSDPLSTEFRGVRVSNPWDWSLDRVERSLEERDLFLLKAHSPHELANPRKGRYGRVAVLFAHCMDTGGYYDYGVRYAVYDGGLSFFEEIPCGRHETILRLLENYLSKGNDG